MCWSSLNALYTSLSFKTWCFCSLQINKEKKQRKRLMPKSDVIVYIQYLLFYSNCWVLYPQVLVNFWQEKLRENSAPHEHWIYWSWATGCKSALKWVWWEKYGLAYVHAHPNLIMQIHFVWSPTPKCRFWC